MRIAGGAILLVAIAGCGPSASSTYEGFATNACDALAILPDLDDESLGGTGELTRVLNESVRTGNVERTGELVAAITAELERSRQSAAAAAAWQPGATAMFHLDRLLLAHEAVLQAKLRRAARDPTAPGASAAFTAAGGDNAWAQIEEAANAVRQARPPGVPAHECPDHRMTW
jgi:hypothetical protein